VSNAIQLLESRMRHGLLAAAQLAALTIAVSGCTVHDEAMPTPQSQAQPNPTNSSETVAAPSPNREFLDEINAAKSWFHAKKTRPIWARRLEQPERVKTLEGEEDVPAGNFLCRGEAGDIWPQTAERLEAKYLSTEEVTDDGWRRYLPHPDNTGVMAARVEHPFAITAKWGELKGKPGDYVVKNYDDRDAPFPEDVWIVDAALFQATYAAVEKPAP
jgi:hypothetical protein